MLKITNTLTGSKEEFKPQKEKVRLYVCGPTVYDDPHIGHVRGAFVFDVIRKYLQSEFCGYQVTFVRNITDVDDKIIEKAREEQGDLINATRKVAQIYTERYHQALDDLGIDGPDEEPKATERIDQMIQMIEHLINQEKAYTADGNVYFAVRSFKDYGKLSRQSLDQLLEEHRVEEEGKKDPLDFALWKKAKPEEPNWSSPWGEGRPGWHIECSVMSQKKSGETLDIHGGGVDLIFPHHENEIAQSEAAWNTPFSHYWMHNGLLTVEGEKMSKSVGNVITAQDILKRGYQPEDLKIFFLHSHYKSPVDFTWEKIEEAKKNRQAFGEFFSNAQEKIGENEEVVMDQEVESLRKEFSDAMNDDFNSPKAMAILFELRALGNRYLLEKSDFPKVSAVVRALKDLGLILSLKSLDDKTEWNQKENSALIEIINQFASDTSLKGSEDIKELQAVINQIRQKAREKKEYEIADQIRFALEKAGFLIKDTKEGTVWRML